MVARQRPATVRTDSGRPVAHVRRRVVWWVFLVLVWSPPWCLAQGRAVGPPGPYVVDIRGTTARVPEDVGFYPPLPEGTLVPARGFGIDTGAHIYFGSLRSARLGAGASLSQVRGTTDDTSLTLLLLAPQLSMNFGTANGWSYLSGGVGVASVRSEFAPASQPEPSNRHSGSLFSWNAGGGARWFFNPHMAVGFDLRFHYVASQAAQVGLAGAPSTFLLLASAGLSVK